MKRPTDRPTEPFPPLFFPFHPTYLPILPDPPYSRQTPAQVLSNIDRKKNKKKNKKKKIKKKKKYKKKNSPPKIRPTQTCKARPTWTSQTLTPERRFSLPPISKHRPTLFSRLSFFLSFFLQSPKSAVCFPIRSLIARREYFAQSILDLIVD